MVHLNVLDTVGRGDEGLEDGSALSGPGLPEAVGPGLEGGSGTSNSGSSKRVSILICMVCYLHITL